MTTTVKDSERSRRLRERWADPAYRAKMTEAAKRGATTTNAKRQKPPAGTGTTETGAVGSPEGQRIETPRVVVPAAATSATGDEGRPKAETRRAWAPWRRRVSA